MYVCIYKHTYQKILLLYTQCLQLLAPTAVCCLPTQNAPTPPTQSQQKNKQRKLNEILFLCQKSHQYIHLLLISKF